jgi:hypothetical protein
MVKPGRAALNGIEQGGAHKCLHDLPLTLVILETVFDHIYFRRAASSRILELSLSLFTSSSVSLLINKQLREAGYGKDLFLLRVANP